MRKVKKYTVIPLFNKDGSKVLLIKKDRTAFAGKLNGVGGKIEDNETPEQGAYREIEEETSLKPEQVKNLTWLGTLTLPEQCDTDNAGLYPELWFYSGIVEDESWAHTPKNETEPVAWYILNENDGVITHLELAGDGNLDYFIRRARRLLFNGAAVSYDFVDEYLDE